MSAAGRGSGPGAGGRGDSEQHVREEGSRMRCAVDLASVGETANPPVLVRIAVAAAPAPVC